MSESSPVASSAPHPDNLLVAEKLGMVADLLEAQSASMFRVRAYRAAAEEVAAMTAPVAGLLHQGGRQALIDLPHIGTSIAAAIQEITETGHLALIDRLLGAATPVEIFQSVPTIGPKLAEDIHSHLDLETLEGLEMAAYDGRLQTVPGIGPRRLRAIQHSLAEMLARRWPKRSLAPAAEPDVAALLEVDRIYRDRAQRGTLPLIAPKRFNPEGARWLPILHMDKDGVAYTALFSNTERAHRLKRTNDWVVIFYERPGAPEGQCTVVTETHPPWEGRRIVRGREAECASHYRGQAAEPSR
ncbi:MAG: DNA-binding protein [Paracoccaceae bacterium]